MLSIPSKGQPWSMAPFAHRARQWNSSWRVPSRGEIDADQESCLCPEAGNSAAARLVSGFGPGFGNDSMRPASIGGGR